jgi:two-component system sensor histidine kinase RegB
VERELTGQQIPALVLEDISVIRDELERCRNILDRMSAESGQTIGEAMSDVSVADLLQAIVDPYEREGTVQASSHGCAASVRLRVPLQGLSQALRGIVQNAVDAAGSDGSPVQVAASCDDRRLRITVQDFGHGMTREVLQRAGEPFFTTKEPGSGMGMGLFLARSVVERLDGKIEIHSTPGKGTTVHVTLPVAGGEESA